MGASDAVPETETTSTEESTAENAMPEDLATYATSVPDASSVPDATSVPDMAPETIDVFDEVPSSSSLSEEEDEGSSHEEETSSTEKVASQFDPNEILMVEVDNITHDKYKTTSEVKVMFCVSLHV